MPEVIEKAEKEIEKRKQEIIEKAKQEMQRKTNKILKLRYFVSWFFLW